MLITEKVHTWLVSYKNFENEKWIICLHFYASLLALLESRKSIGPVVVVEQQSSVIAGERVATKSTTYYLVSSTYT